MPKPFVLLSKVGLLAMLLSSVLFAPPRAFGQTSPQGTNPQCATLPDSINVKVIQYWEEDPNAIGPFIRNVSMED